MTDPDQPPAPFNQGLAGRTALLVALAALALAGNWAHVTLFFGVDYLFGSVAVLLGVVWLGPLPAMAVAAVGGLYTLEMWGHPWALVIFVMEAGGVGLLRRRLSNLVLADLAFWLVLGAPLVVALYLGMMGIALPQAGLIALKQPVNGLFNAIIANAVILLLRYRRQPIAFSEILFNLFFGVILLMGLALMAFQAHTVNRVERQTMATLLAEQTDAVASRLEANPGNFDTRPELTNGLRQALNAPNGVGLLNAEGRFLTRVRLPDWLQQAERRRLRPNLVGLLPPEGQGLPTMVRWKQAFFAHSESVRLANGAREILVTRPAGPMVQQLARVNLEGHAALSAIALLGSLLAFFLARALANPFERLQMKVQDLPERIQRGEATPIPNSALRELDDLGSAFQAMTESLGTSFRELEAERRNLEAAVRNRTRDLERFTEATAHHLQEPVRQVNAFAQRLEKRRGDPEDSETRDIQHVVQGARHMSEMLQGLQRYLALDARPLRHERVDLVDCLDRAWQGLGDEAVAADAKLLRPSAPPATARGDAELLRQLFELLLANALSYARPGIAPRIEITTELEEGRVHVRICDNGRGVSPEYRDRVFRMFERMRPWEDPAGPGTGLALARKITELHDGEIRLTDAPETPGLCVHLTLPAAEPTKEIHT